MVSGSDQSARAGTAFALPLVVEVKDSNDIVVPGVEVTFTAPTDGPAASFDPTTVQTGSAGRASVTATANDRAGNYTVQASISGVNPTADFTLFNSPLPSKLEATVSYSTAAIASGGEAAATIRITNTSGSTLQHALFASDLPALPNGLALVGQANPGTCTSEYMPLANRNYCEMAATVTSETLGTHKWTGNGQENTANSAYIALTDATGVSVYGEPATITVVSGNEQSVLVSTAFALPLVVEVRDSNDIVVPGVEVTFTAPSGGPSATLDPSTIQTNAEGRASTTATANTSQGDFAVQASVSGVDSPAGFALFNIRLPFELTATVSYSAASIASGGEATATIRITNTSNIMLQSAPPTTDLPTLPSGLSMVGEADQGTCAGQYMPLSPGSYCQMTATVTSTTLGTHKWTGNGQQNTYNNAYIALTDADGLGVYSTATTVTVSDGDDQSVAVGGSFAMLSVKVTDANGIGVPDVEVTFTAPASGASVTQPETAATTDGSGLSSVSLTANQTAGAYLVEATIDGVDTPTAFHLSNLAGAPAGLSVTSGSGQATKVDTAFENSLVARVVDDFGNPLSGVIVTFKAPADGASGTFENDQTTATSDADGNATSAIFTANAAVGSYTVMAMLTANSTSFSLENTTAVVEPPPLPAITALSPASGAAAGGTSVTITGSDLAAATAVTFDGAEATFELVDDTLVAVTPPGTGMVDVLVTSPDGTSNATEASRFSYDAPLDPPPSADSQAIDDVQETFSPIVAQQSARSIVGSVSDAIRMGLSGGSQTSFSASEIFLAYGPTSAEPSTPFDDILLADTQSMADNVSIWLDTTGQGILPLSTTPERGWQVNITGGVSIRVTPDFLVGGLAGHERFSYRSDDTGATLSGSGTSLGAYAGWDLGGRLLVSLGVINTALDYRASSGAVSGNFQASRWLVTGDISGQYTLGDFTVQPSATLLGIWESQDAYTDTLLGFHDERQFGSASASAGIRISRALPISEDWELVPYVGAYLDTDAEAAIGDGEATYGLSGSIAAGAALSSAGGLHIGLDGTLNGLGTDTLSLSAKGAVRSSF